MVTTTQLRAVCEVVKEGSFAAAGRKLGYTSSAVSQQIAALAVDDTVRGVVVTGAGERPLGYGLLTPGYFRDDAATAQARRGPWWRTSDRGRVVDGALHFVGRLTDSVRHRGENVSAWEIETVVNAHPAVAESAVVGVPAAEGEEDVKVFVMLADAAAFDPAELVAWCGDRLASYQVPRYVAVADAFTRTPSLRIKKADLSRTTDDCYDARSPHPSHDHDDSRVP